MYQPNSTGKTASQPGGNNGSIGIQIKFLRFLLLTGLVLNLFGLGCNQAPPAPKAEKKDPVVKYVYPVEDMVTDYEGFTGRLDALKTATLTARVTGYIDSAPFKEGDLVKEGDVLFTIDPRPYKADYNQALANLAVAEAEARLQNKNVTRAQKLIANRTIAQEDYDQIVATWEKSKANIEAAIATRDKAKLYLDYTQVKAPWNGRISRRNVDPGNLVNADNTQLTTLVSEEKIYAYFDVDERTYLELKEVGKEKEVGKTGYSSWAAEEKFPVLMSLPKEDRFDMVGMVNFVDNRVSSGSGTIRMRGIFENPNLFLKAGMFVRIRLPVGNPRKAILIPDESILNDQGKKNVYVMEKRKDKKDSDPSKKESGSQSFHPPGTESKNEGMEEGEVVYRTVTLGQTLQGKNTTLRVVVDGVKPDDKIIVTGLQRIRPGMKVQGSPSEPLQSPGSPLTRILNGLSKSKTSPASPPEAKVN